MAESKCGLAMKRAASWRKRTARRAGSRAPTPGLRQIEGSADSLAGKPSVDLRKTFGSESSVQVYAGDGCLNTLTRTGGDMLVGIGLKVGSTFAIT
jgi:hypothetical protein